MIVVTAEQMREMDRLTIEKYGVPSLSLMERAGEGIAQAILERFSRMAKKGVLIVAGKGNNGGDGLVVARQLIQKGCVPFVFLFAAEDDVPANNRPTPDRCNARTSQRPPRESFHAARRVRGPRHAIRRRGCGARCRPDC